MKEIFDKHNDWLNIVKSFGANKFLAEDIVQDMYLKIGILLKKGLEIRYNENEINYYYIYLTLKSLYINIKKKKSKFVFLDPKDCENLFEKSDIEINNIAKVEEKVNDELKKMHWYDSKIWELCKENTIAELSRKTKISYWAIYATKNKVENKLKEIVKQNEFW